VQTGDFLRLLWGKNPSLEGDVTFWTKQTKLSVHLPLQDALSWNEVDERELLLHVNANQDLYISPGLRRPGLLPDQKGTWQDIVALCGFVLDIDLFDPERPDAHNAKNLPTTEEDVAVVLGDAPDPTLVVNTGYGVHLWWLFDKILELPDLAARLKAKMAFRDFQRPFLERAKQAGFQLDNTASINHVFRLPGTKNWK
jgi:putative DNA primase/helicase